MSETKDENKLSLLQESENVNNTTEFSEAKGTEDKKPKADVSSY